MNVEAVRKVLQTMRANIARYGFSPDYNDDATRGVCFIRAMRGANVADADHFAVARYARQFVPPAPGFAECIFCSEGLAHLTTESALAIIDVALLALPQSAPAPVEREVQTA